MDTNSEHENFHEYMQERKLYEENFIQVVRNASIDVNDSQT